MRGRSLGLLVVLSGVLFWTGCAAKRAYNKGVTWTEQGQYGKAILCYREATEARSDFHLAHFNMAKCYERLNLQEKALNSYERAVDARPDMMEAYWNMALILEDMERWEQALQVWQQSLALSDTDQDSRQARWHIASIEEQLTELDETSSGEDSKQEDEEEG